MSKNNLLNLENLYMDKDEDEKYKVKIKSVYEDKFVVVSSNEYLYATGDQSSKNAIFKLVMLDDNNVKIMQKYGNFVRINAKDFLVADTDKKGGDVFKYSKIDDKEYVLKAPNGYYVKVKDEDKRLVAKAESANKKTMFKFKKID